MLRSIRFSRSLDEVNDAGLAHRLADLLHGVDVDGHAGRQRPSAADAATICTYWKPL